MNDLLSETSLTIAMVFGSVVLTNFFLELMAVAVAGLYFGKVTIKIEANMRVLQHLHLICGK